MPVLSKSVNVWYIVSDAKAAEPNHTAIANTLSEVYMLTTNAVETPNKERKPRSLSAKVFRMFLAGTVDALNQAADKSPEEILQAVNSAVESFVGDAEQFDDLTMMCIEYRGKDR